jgi:hypothetical protein
MSETIHNPACKECGGTGWAQGLNSFDQPAGMMCPYYNTDRIAAPPANPKFTVTTNGAITDCTPPANDAGTTYVFPWLCFKCGHGFGSQMALVTHIVRASHQLSHAELIELEAAKEAVSKSLLKLSGEYRADSQPTSADEKIRNDALEYAAQIADEHWPESGHVHQKEAISCQMSISVAIRKAKTLKEWEPTEHERLVVAQAEQSAWAQAIERCGELVQKMWMDLLVRSGESFSETEVNKEFNDALAQQFSLQIIAKEHLKCCTRKLDIKENG